MKDIKQEIIDAGKYLLKEKLIARTWGNVSARISSEEFYITPSGKAYTDIKKDDLTAIKISDCSYDKTAVKPSSEKKVHAVIYKHRPEINYVIHTHQLYASAICAEGFSVVLPDGTFLPCAKYGLPGTKKLKNNVEKEVATYKNCDMILLEKHGAFVFGKTMKETISKAEKLEKQCKQLFEIRVKDFKIPEKMDAWLDDYAQLVDGNDKVDDKEALNLVIKKNAAASLYARDGKPLNVFDRKLQNVVYKYKYSKLKGTK